MNLFGSDVRSVKMQWNVKVSLICKMIIAVITFLQVPLVLKCLGEYSNGVWLTISSLLIWIDAMDIGLGNGLRNRLAEAVAEENYRQARILTSSTFAMLLIIIIPAFVLLSLGIVCFDMYNFFNVNETIIEGLDTTLIVAVAMISCTFVLKFTSNVYMGLQLPSVSNIIQALGLTLAFLLTWLLYITHTASFFTIVTVNTMSPLIIYAIAYPITFNWLYPELRPSFKIVSKETIRELMGISVSFFTIQISSLLLFASSNILISKLYNPTEVTLFQICHRYMSLMITGFALIAMPVWNATTDAYTKKDWQWIHQADRKMHTISCLFAILFIIMVAISNLFYSVWLPNDVNIPSLNYTILVGIYVLIQLYSIRYSYFLNGVGALRLQIYMTFIDAVLFIMLANIVACYSSRLEHFIIVLCVTQLPGYIINKIQFQRILNQTATGIWRIR